MGGQSCLVPTGSIWRAPRVSTHGGGGLLPIIVGYFIGSLLQSSSTPGGAGAGRPGALVTGGSRAPGFSRVWGQRCPLSILTVHPDHSFQRADGIEVGFLFPAFF